MWFVARHGCKICIKILTLALKIQYKNFGCCYNLLQLLNENGDQDVIWIKLKIKNTANVIMNALNILDDKYNNSVTNFE